MSSPQFFDQPKPIALADLVQSLDVEIASTEPDVEIVGIAPIDSAQSGDITFFDNPKYIGSLASCEASAIIIAPKFLERVPKGTTAVICKDPYRTFAEVAGLLFPQSLRPLGLGFEGDFHPSAHVHPTAQLEDGVVIEPNVVVGEFAEIGSGTVLQAGAIVGANTKIGRDCSIGFGAVIQHSLLGDRVIVHPNATLGQDGFGFSPGVTHKKVPQLGRVIIQDDVDIGACTSIDRGTTRDTVVGQGTKIDNHVQIGHNCTLGRNCFIVAKVGLAGSTTIGDYVTFAGASGSRGHLSVGSHSQIAGMSAVIRDLPEKSRVGGIPAIPIRHFLKELARLNRLGSGKDGDGKL